MFAPGEFYANSSPQYYGPQVRPICRFGRPAFDYEPPFCKLDLAASRSLPPVEPRVSLKFFSLPDGSVDASLLLSCWQGMPLAGPRSFMRNLILPTHTPPGCVRCVCHFGNALFPSPLNDFFFFAMNWTAFQITMVWPMDDCLSVPKLLRLTATRQEPGGLPVEGLDRGILRPEDYPIVVDHPSFKRGAG